MLSMIISPWVNVTVSEVENVVVTAIVLIGQRCKTFRVDMEAIIGYAFLLAASYIMLFRLPSTLTNNDFFFLGKFAHFHIQIIRLG